MGGGAWKKQPVGVKWARSANFAPTDTPYHVNAWRTVGGRFWKGIWAGLEGYNSPGKLEVFIWITLHLTSLKLKPSWRVSW